MASNEPDLTRILGGIYVGSIDPIVKHTPLHAEYNITHILSVIKFQVIPEYLIRKNYTLKNIPIDDDDYTDILQYFNETNTFIDNCLFPDEPEYSPELVDFKKKPQKGALYIHCQAGMSRSVAFTVAYLMYRYGFDLKTSLHAVKRKRASAQPNDNFIEQLKLFEEMGGRYVSLDHPIYKQWKLTNSVKLDPTGNDILADDNMFREDEEKDLDKMSPEDMESVTVARCKMCRKHLAMSTSFIKHEPPSKESSEGHFIRRAAGSRRIIGIQDSQAICSHYFVEPLNWMKEELQGKQELEGKFLCPGCSSKVGGYNWKGSRCSCGKWVIPAIHLQSNKVDNVSLTRKTLPNMIKFEGKN
ncbi:hypothetical protein Kpol_1057p10 [Vanderwaltozyma polyspora DSM 70294]|uniref:protein-tyrosine-phosphatase n=1 Tax=Vanderwaltozyma polyspora (strain ATCC 22028 / DSM 70294 / BCRC 21397 / CBS 2163 / NBRC 10782 / NRRL Y-8283 / UCD 57-17) TaxID=436907 RepID=A7TPH8_VANPO|nr:uncharacterized protein Kpol_1057p10 [Vanderwaltozyma polyspora DSM 70294]EDO15822.1 hypothetical protein Kpol_1057p10 [Vanderwaltozyma polyspora DSM 70294]